MKLQMQHFTKQKFETMCRSMKINLTKMLNNLKMILVDQEVHLKKKEMKIMYQIRKGKISKNLRTKIR